MLDTAVIGTDEALLPELGLEKSNSTVVETRLHSRQSRLTIIDF